jgi:hypothetical protein
MLASVGYDVGKMNLEVEFTPDRHGKSAVAVYDNVPERVYLALMAAPSPGVYFAANIKNAFKFKYA